MEELLLIGGFEHGTDADKLHSYIQGQLKIGSLENLWTDPFMEPRAVCFCKEKIDLAELKQWCSNNPVAAQNVFVATAQRASGIFIRTYNKNLRAPRDKLCLIFGSKRKGGSKVLSIESLHPSTHTDCRDCYELVFENGWDAVLQVCKRDWELEGKKLTVLPYFDCFKENERIQNERFRKEMTYPVTVGRQTIGDTLTAPVGRQTIGDSLTAPVGRQTIGDTLTAPVGRQTIGDTLTAPVDPLPDRLVEAQSVIQGKHLESAPNAQNISQENLSVIFDPLFVLFLACCDFETAAAKVFESIHISLNISEGEIQLKGLKQDLTRLKSMLLGTYHKVAVQDCVKQLLRLFKVQNELMNLLWMRNHTLSIAPEDSVLYVFSEQEKIVFTDYISSMITVTQCPEFTHDSRVDEEKWNIFVSKHTSHNHHIVVNNRTISLISFCVETYQHESLMKQFRDFENNTSKGSAIRVDKCAALQNASPLPLYESEPYYSAIVVDKCAALQNASPLPVDESEPYYSERFPFILEEIEYVNLYLLGEIRALEEEYKFHHVKLVFDKNSITIKSRSRHNISVIRERIRDLFKVVNQENKVYTFPSIERFFESEQGKTCVKEISERNRCLIALSRTCYDTKQSPVYGCSQAKENDLLSGRMCTVPVLGSALINNCRIFFIQAKMQDIHVQSTLTICHGSGEYSNVKPDGSSFHMKMVLPAWKESHDKQGYQHFQGLKNHFRDMVKQVISQVAYTKSSSLALAISPVPNCESPFPLDVIAEVIVTEMKLHLEDSDHCFVICICEPQREAIFKAFIHQLPSYSTSTDLYQWKNIFTSESQHNFVDYDKKKLRVSVVYRVDQQHIPYKSLLCHPVLHEDEAERFLERILYKHLQKDAMKTLWSCYPDGLHLNEVFHIQDTRRMLYWSQEWGFDSVKAIRGAVRVCLMEAKKISKTVVYIHPPGLKGHPQFPKDFLAHHFFDELDTLVCQDYFSTLKEIVVVVADAMVRQVFETELQKRYPAHSLGKLQGKAPEDIDQKVTFRARPCTIQFWGIEADSLQAAHRELEYELRQLMEVTRKSFKLTAEKTRLFEKFMREYQYHVVVEVIRHLKSVKPKKKKMSGASELKLNNSTLTVKGLYRDDVQKFIDLLLQESILLQDEAFQQMYKNVVTGKKQNAAKSCNRRKENEYKINTNTEIDGHSENMYSTQSQISPQNSPLKSRYLWMYATHSGELMNFQNMELADSKKIEEAFINRRSELHLVSDSVCLVNFITMTALILKQTRGIIRTEIFNDDMPIYTGEFDGLLDPIKEGSEEFCAIASTLKESLSSSHAIQGLKAQRVQNGHLIKRFRTKESLMGEANAYKMWHRVSKQNWKNICKFGFHSFLTVQNPESCGSLGVTFLKEAKSCLTEKDKKSGNYIYLLLCKVLQGFAGSQLSSDSLESADDGASCASVQIGYQCTVVSDAQACPEAFITFRLAKVDP